MHLNANRHDASPQRNNYWLITGSLNDECAARRVTGSNQVINNEIPVSFYRDVKSSAFSGCDNRRAGIGEGIRNGRCIGPELRS